MSELSDLILPVGLVFIGAFAVQKLFTGYSQNPVCTGGVSQTCVGPLCWSNCTSPAAGVGNQTVGPSQQTPSGTPSGDSNLDVSNTPCDQLSPLQWVWRADCWPSGTTGW